MDYLAESIFFLLVLAIDLVVIPGRHLEPPAPEIIISVTAAVILAVLVLRFVIHLTRTHVDGSLEDNRRLLEKSLQETRHLYNLLDERLDLQLANLPDVLRRFFFEKRKLLLKFERQLTEYTHDAFPTDDIYPELSLIASVLTAGESIVAVASQNLDDFSQPAGIQYLAYNINAATNGVHVRRLFVMVGEWSPTLRGTVHSHAQELAQYPPSGAKWLRAEEIHGTALEDADFVIFGNEVLVSQEGRLGEATLDIAQDDIRSRLASFERVWLNAKDVTELSS
jgi:hypothetical protein